jgi:hypothetical protein
MTEPIRTRSVSFPADAVARVMDVLCDLDYGLPIEEAQELARDIVIDVTLAVDKLREVEAQS